MGLTDEQIDSVIEMHAETVEALKNQRDTYKADAEKLTDAQAELAELKKDGYKEKYEKEHSDFESYKAAQSAKETRDAKAAAVRKYFEAKGITGKSLDIAMRGAGAEIDAAELNGEGLKDTTALDALISGDFAAVAMPRKCCCHIQTAYIIEAYDIIRKRILYRRQKRFLTSVPHIPKAQPLRRGGEARVFPVAAAKRRGSALRIALAAPGLNKCPDNDAHHVI